MLLKVIDTFRNGLLKKKANNQYYNGYSSLDYYDNVNVITGQPSSFIHLLDPKETADSMSVVAIEKEVKPYDLAFGASVKVAIESCGRPSHSIDNSFKIANCIALFYKKRIGNIKLVTQLHFFADKLFFARTDFSTNLSSQELKEKITTLTLKKYTSKTDYIENKSIKMVDSFRNVMIIDLQNVHPSINYVAGDRTVKNQIENLIKQKEIESKQKEKLINDELLKRL